MTDIKKDLLKFINKIAEEHEYKNCEITLEEISSGGANFTSELFTVVIKGINHDDLHLFAKVGTVGEKFRSDVGWHLFTTEFTAYTKLRSVFQSLEEENEVPQQHRFLFPKYYGFEPTLYQETLVLENLMVQGFRPSDRFTSIDWEYASSAIAELAKFHALCFAYGERYSADYEEILALIKPDWKDGALDSLSRNSVENALNTVRPEHKEALSRNLKVYMKDIVSTSYAPINHTIIAHGDFRGGNLMHRIRSDGKVDIKIVDLQTLQGGSPVTDLLYFIFTGSDEQFRAQYYDKLIDHYYTQLCEAMKRLHLNPDEIYSREDFDFELKEKLPFGLSLAVFSLPVITVEAENAPQVNEDLELSSFSVGKTSDLYAERLNGVINDYVKWGLLK